MQAIVNPWSMYQRLQSADHGGEINALNNEPGGATLTGSHMRLSVVTDVAILGDFRFHTLLK